MFCPKCGNANQTENSFCRNCGIFLPDFDKITKITTPEQHLTINTTFSVMSAIVSLFLVIMLYATFLGKDGTSWVIYLTAGFLTAMFFWQAQVVYRNILLKKQLPNRRKESETIENTVNNTTNEIDYNTDKLLSEANLENYIPTSVTENTTKHLKIERK
ncbi:MAG: zinc ribbon domain-containing protein [Pyrinomonadaceae bacterium]|jgi:uncharacterized membrane protein YvbJ|nr:zinc ribbon domain-containing protein [Pyrinomonadaceae bacterium]